MTMCNMNGWNVGDLPVFAYAMAHEGKNLDELQADLESKFKTAVNKVLETKGQMLGAFGYQLAFQRKVGNWNQFQQGAMMMKRMGRDDQTAIQMALLQDALNRCQSHHLLGKNAEELLEQLKDTDAGTLEKLLREVLVDEKKHVVQIKPTN